MSAPLSGWRVVVTGDVPHMTREAAKDAVRMMGGTAVGTVDARTDLLVVGAGAGAAKLARAAALRLRQLPAGPFAELAENPDRWDGRPLGVVPEPVLEEADLPPERPRAEPPGAQHGRAASAHVAGMTTWTRAGQWTVVARCRCGHGAEGSTSAEAERGHRAHRVAVGDLEPDGAS